MMIKLNARRCRALTCAMVLIAAIIGATATILAPIAAGAQTQAAAARVSLTDALKDPSAILRSFDGTDLQIAIEDANSQTPPDTIAATCYIAIKLVVDEQAQSAARPIPGGFASLQKDRNARSTQANWASPTGTFGNLNVACAPLVFDINATLAHLGALVGVVK